MIYLSFWQIILLRSSKGFILVRSSNNIIAFDKFTSFIFQIIDLQTNDTLFEKYVLLLIKKKVFVMLYVCAVELKQGKKMPIVSLYIKRGVQMAIERSRWVLNAIDTLAGKKETDN